MHPYVNTAITAARKAGNMIMRTIDYNGDLEITAKGVNDYVTNTDKEAENIIVRILHKSYPEHNFITEEQGVITYDQNRDVTWIIDPIDGTTNFIHRLPQFAISIAVKQAGKIEHAVIYQPSTQDLYTASRGQGAQLNGRRIRVATKTQLSGALLAMSMPRSQAYVEHYCNAIKALRSQVAGVRHHGATALDCAGVAAGKLDGLWVTCQQPWDLAAGMLILKEAGGIATDLAGNDCDIDQGVMVAANAKLIRPLLKLLHECAPK